MGLTSLLAGGVSGALGSSSRNSQARRLFKKQKKLLQRAKGDYSLGNIQARSELGKGIEAQRAGYDKALASASKSSRSARRSAKEEATKREGQLLSRYGIGGNYGSTALDQARAGIGSRLSREMESIDSSLAGLLGQLAIGQGSAEASGQQALSGLSLEQGAYNSSLTQQLMGLVPDREDPLMGGLGGILGAYSGQGGF